MIRLRVIDLPTTMKELPEGQEWVFEMVNNILIEVLGTIAEQERETIHRRQAEGIAAAKAKGKHLGRPKAEIPETFEDYYQRWKNGEVTASWAIKEMNISRGVFYRTVNSTRPVVNNVQKVLKVLIYVQKAEQTFCTCLSLLFFVCPKGKLFGYFCKRYK